MLIRAVQPADMDLIRDSWWRSVQGTCPAADGVPRAFLVDTLDRALTGRWSIRVLCPDEETPDEVAGWVLYRSPVEVGWVAVKPRYRGLGFARALLDDIGVKPGRLFCALVPRGGHELAAHFGVSLTARPYSLLV